MKNKLQVLLIMSSKFTLYGIVLQLFFVASLWATELAAQETKSVKEVNLSIQVESRTILDIFRIIEQKTSFKFFYENKYIDRSLRYDFNDRSISVNDILLQISRDSNLKFKQINNTINVTTKDPAQPGGIAEVEIIIQTRTVSGKVTSFEDEEGIPGVNVIEKGTNNGIVTNVQGNYSLEVAEGATIVFSSVGFTTEEVQVGNQSVIDVAMTQDVKQLQELVVVGYGAQEKAKVTGSVSKIGKDEIMRAPVANAADLLVGNAPGVVTKLGSGLPGNDAADISIRGFGDPLVLVDGVQTAFNKIDPNEIESITVLKDAAAAIYGSRAGNGVILITTKRGTEGKTQITYHGNVSFQNPTVMPDPVNSWQYAEMFREAELNDGASPTFTEEDIEKYRAGNDPNFPNENWYDAVFNQWVPMQQHNVNISGGNESVKYFVSGGLMDQASLFTSGDWNFNRYNVRSNVDVSITEKLTASIDLAYRLEVRDEPSIDLDRAYIHLSTAQPIFEAVLPDPDRAAFSGFSDRSPLAYTYQEKSGFNDDKREFLNTQLTLNYEIFEGLNARAQFSYTTRNDLIRTQQKSFPIYSYDYENEDYVLMAIQGQSSIEEQYRRNRQLYPLLSMQYEKNFGFHNVDALLLYEEIDIYNHYSSTSRTDLISDNLPYLFAGSPANMINSGSPDQQGRKSVVARVNYDFNSRYLFSATFRADGVPWFAPGRQWGYFPGLSAGWRISDEPFLKEVSFLDNLKLRASYSQSGVDRVRLNGQWQVYRHLSNYEILTGINEYYFHGSTPGRIIRNTGLANPDVTWYTMTTYNMGLDAEFVEGKFGFEFDYFYRLQDDILAEPQGDVPFTFGGDLPLQNLEAQDDRGFELVLKHRNRVGNFDYRINAFGAYTREKNVRVSEEEFDDPRREYLFKRQGQWTNRTIGYLSDGLFMTQEEIDSHPVDQDQAENATLKPGDIRYIDINNDSLIDWRDQEFIGFGTRPSVTYGLNLAANWKGFGIDVLFQGGSMFNINPIRHTRAPFTNESVPLDYQYQYRWQPDPNDPTRNINPDVQLPAATMEGTNANNSRTSDFWLQDGTYLRLRNLNINYSLPDALISRLGIGSARLYLAGTNIINFNRLGIFKNSWDPETQLENNSRNFDGTAYPPLRTWTLGLNVSL